jgi:hypothetical protein
MADVSGRKELTDVRHRLSTSLLHLGITIGAGLLVVARASTLAWPRPKTADLTTPRPGYRASDSR